jgi:hypothetical protein
MFEPRLYFIGLGRRRRQRQVLLVGLHRVLRTIQQLEAVPERQMEARLRRRQFRALAEFVHGGFLVAHFVERHAEVEVRDVIGWKQIACALVIVNGLGPLA